METTAKRLELAFGIAETQLHPKGDTEGVQRLRRDVMKFLQTYPGRQPGADTGGVWFGSEVPTATSQELYGIPAAARRLLDAILYGGQSVLSGQRAEFPTQL